MMMKPLVAEVYLKGLKDLKSGVRIFRMIREAGVPQHLEIAI
jgi:hypothetical protein